MAGIHPLTIQIPMQQTFTLFQGQCGLYTRHVQSKFGRRRQQNQSVLKQNGTKKKTAGSTSSTSSFHDASQKRRRSSTGQSAESLRLLCLMASLFALFRISADQLELATYGNQRINCKVYQVGAF